MTADGSAHTEPSAAYGSWYDFPTRRPLRSNRSPAAVPRGDS